MLGLRHVLAQRPTPYIDPSHYVAGLVLADIRQIMPHEIEPTSQAHSSDGDVRYQCASVPVAIRCLKLSVVFER
jgi:hypothetical protein